MCENSVVTIDHIISCSRYGPAIETDWKEIDGNDLEKQLNNGVFIQNRQKLRKQEIIQREAGQTSITGSIAPDT